MPLVTELTLKKSDFATNAESARLDMQRMQGRVTQLSGTLAVMGREARAAGGANDELRGKLKALRMELNEAKVAARSFASEYVSITAAAKSPMPMPQESAHGGGGRAANMEAGHSIRSVFDMVGAGQNLGQALQTELPRLLQASGTGLGGMIAIEGATSIVKGITESVEKARELRKELRAAFEGPGMGTGSENAIKKQIEELAAMGDKLMPENQQSSLIDWVGRQGKNAYRGVTGGKSVEDETDDNIVALDERRQRLSEELVRRKADSLALDERAAREGEAAVAADRERLALKQRIAEVQDDKSLDGTAQARMVDLLREESRLRQEHIAQAKEQRQVEDAQRVGNLSDQVSGDDTDVSRAQRALEAARGKRDATPAGTPEGRAADEAVTKAELELAKVKQITAERRSQEEIVAKVDGITGSSSAKQRAQINAEKRDLMEQLNEKSPTYQPNKEKQGEIVAQVGRKDAALKGLDLVDAQRGMDAQASDIQAGAGRGPDAQIKTLREEMALLEKRKQLIFDTAAKDHRGELGADETSKSRATTRSYTPRRRGSMAST